VIPGQGTGPPGHAPEPSAPREDAVAKVTGAAVYTTDLALPGTLHVALARSGSAHGVLLQVGTAAAAAHPGVVTVVTGDDLADVGLTGEWIRDRPPLARGRVRYHGEPIVAVVATSASAARAAADLVSAEVEPLPAHLDPVAALDGGATALHPDLAPDNVCARAVYELGDVDAVDGDGLRRHRATYSFPAVYHYAMEPFATIARWSDEGLELWTGTQEPYKLRADVARAMGLPAARVRLHVPYVGGGYGSRTAPKHEPLVAALARRLPGAPIKLVATTGESALTVTRHAALVTVETLVDAAGTMLSRETTVLFDTGAYADKGPRVARKGAYRAAGPYRIPNVRSTALAVYTNHPPAGAFRGFATPQVVWACESANDEIAAELGEDPLSFRARHLKVRGDAFLRDDLPLDTDPLEGVRRALSELDAREPARPAGEGRSATGMAVAVKDGGGSAGIADAELRLHPDGSVELRSATVEVGQGARTVLRRLAAESLGVPVERVRVLHVDTSLAPHDVGTGASRSTVAMGTAVEGAARDLLNQLEDLWVSAGGTRCAVRLDGADLVGDGVPRPLAEVLGRARGLSPEELGPLVGHGRHHIGSDTGVLGALAPFYEASYAAAEVRVDSETGEVTVVRYVSVADVGLAIDRTTCVGQDEGAVMMGLGHTLHEELTYDAEGRLENGSMVDYRVPRATDVPAGGLHTVLIEQRDGPGPGGAKGAGEGGIIPVAPAIANALHAATGVRIRTLPLTPERVWRALRRGG
jgi:CO/xanthine dehydrogenase Mo-binding subunit